MRGEAGTISVFGDPGQGRIGSSETLFAAFYAAKTAERLTLTDAVSSEPDGTRTWEAFVGFNRTIHRPGRIPAAQQSALSCVPGLGAGHRGELRC